MIEFKDISKAADLINPYIVRTPLLENSLLNKRLDGRVLFKAECLQRTGSFKIRGASNKMLGLDAERLKQGVVAYSSGNHAQGVAAAARTLKVSSTIVIPEDAPALKIANTREYGANIVLYDRYTQSREAIAAEIAEREGRVIIPPYDDEAVIAGQGTIGLEIIEQLAERSLEADALFCPCGGGGLVSGVATAIKSKLPKVEVYAVEPKDFDDTRRSLESGDRVENNPEARSICDAIVTPMPGEITFEINRRLLSGGIAVDDQSVKKAMITAFTDLKLAVEPGAAVGLAALLTGAFPVKGQTVVVILSGGNIELEALIALQSAKL